MLFRRPSVGSLSLLLLSAKLSRVWKSHKRLGVRLHILNTGTFLLADAKVDKKAGKGLRGFGEDAVGGERNLSEPVNKEKKPSGS